MEKNKWENYEDKFEVVDEEDDDWDEYDEDDDFWDDDEEEEEPDCIGQFYQGVGSEDCAFCEFAGVCEEISRANLKDEEKRRRNKK